MGNTAGQRTVSSRGQGRLQSSATAAMHARWITSACARGLRVPMLVCALAGALLLPQSSQARTADSDRDGLANRFEKRHAHTNPRKADTDGDKLGTGTSSAARTPIRASGTRTGIACPTASR